MNIIKDRRSCREFKKEIVDEKLILKIIEAGCWAPSPLNLQPWEFIIINDDKIKEKIQKIAEEAKEDVIKNNGPEWVKKYNTHFLKDAPIIISVIVDPLKSGLGKYFGQKNGAIMAGATCIQNMLLMATKLKLGSLFFTFFNPKKLKNILNVPDNFEIIGLIPIGYPENEIKSSKRKKPLIYKNKYKMTYCKLY